MKVVVAFTHKYNSNFRDVQGPYDAHPSDFESLEAARKWFARHLRMKLGRVTWRKEGKRYIFFPHSRSASSPNAIIVMPGSRLRLTAREIARMADLLRQKGYSQPGSYARRLYREGVRLEGRWTEEGTAEGHRKEGGVTRHGHRYVSGVKERLYVPRGGAGSLEMTHGFRDPSRRRKKRRASTSRRRRS